MKVLFINEECGTGSTGRICTDIATALEEQGHTVKIAYSRNANIMPAQFQKYAVRIGNDMDLILHGVKARLLDGAGFGSGVPTKKFIKWVQEYDPDVIHLHNLHGYYINVEILFEYLRTCGKKVLWTLHDVWAFTGHSAYCDAVQCEKWKSGCGNCPQFYVYPKTFIDRSTKNFIKKRNLFTEIKNLEIITPSKWLADLVQQSFLKEYSVSVIHNGIDTRKFHPVESNFREKNGLESKKILLSVATMWNDLKGYTDFFKLAEMIGDTYQIIMVGGREQAPDLPVPSNIMQINRIQNIREMVELYSVADVYLNLTYCDTYPTVNLESVACGTPVITYAVGGSTESALEFGGLAVKRGDFNGIVNALKKTGELKVKINDVNMLDKKHAVTEYLKRY